MSNQEIKFVYMLGAFPPPVHGMSNVNKTIFEILSNKGVAIQVIDTSPGNLNSNLFLKLQRVKKLITGLLVLIHSKPSSASCLYMSLSGGFGQLYEILFLLIARSKRMNIFIHHHSYQYLTNKSNVTAILTKISGESSTHIVLCQGMQRVLQLNYSKVKNVLVVSNSVFISMGGKQSHIKRKKIKKIGFISNISDEKGIFEFIELVAKCESDDLSVKAYIAGPFKDLSIENEVMNKVKNLTNIFFLGSIYGEDKISFYKDIDVLIFPTKYKNEAEPLTLFEAMKYSVPIIAYNRGCISEILGSDRGLLIEKNKIFADEALLKIKSWLLDVDKYREASLNAYQYYLKSQNKYHKGLNKLLSQMLSDKVKQ